MSNPTTPFGWQMPTNTDLVTDLPADFEVFGQAVATSMQDLLGGTTGQVLAKASNADMDFVWSADAAGMTNPMTTTGDVIYSSPGSTPVRLGIGTANQVLRVNSGATAPEWATPAAAGGMTLISETIASGLSSLSFSSLGSYKQLILMWAGIRHSTTGSAFGIRFNNNSSSIYYSQGMGMRGAVAQAQGDGQDQILCATVIAAAYPFGEAVTLAAQSTDVSGYLVLDNYTSATKGKSFFISFGYYNNTVSLSNTRVTTGYFDSTTAVTSIDIFRTAGSATFTNQGNSTIRLYGVS